MSLYCSYEESYLTEDWESYYNNWSCLHMNLKWLSENWDYLLVKEEGEEVYQK